MTDESAAPAQGVHSLFYTEILSDVPVTLRVILGEATLTIADVLKCDKGSVIPLGQKVGDPFAIMLHNRVIAEGEVVTTGESLGIKITAVKSPEDAAPAAE